MDHSTSIHILIAALWLSVLSFHANACGYNTSSLTGTISTPNRESSQKPQDCSWTITAPPLHRIQLQATDFSLYEKQVLCRIDWIFVDSITGKNQIVTHGSFCGSDFPTIISKENQVRISYHFGGFYSRSKSSSFTLAYKAVPLSKAEVATYWIENKDMEKENIPRAVSSLFLINEKYFLPGNSKGQNITIQLSLQLGEDLVRNFTRPMTAGDLALRVSALLATCINPRSFYGVDLVHSLRQLVSNASGLPNPNLFLTLCSAGDKMTDKDIKILKKIVEIQKPEMFWLDYQAMALLTLVCVQEQDDEFDVKKQIAKASAEIKGYQTSDGGFGSLQTTALVIQALTAAEIGDAEWNKSAALSFVDRARQSDGLYGSIRNLYAVAPIITGKTLLYINASKCDFTQDDETSVNQIRANLTDPISLVYSVWIGDHVDVTSTVTLKAPKGTKFLDFMRLAGDQDEKFKFRWTNVKNSPYVYVIGELFNDPSSGRYWTLYVGPHMMMLQPFTEGLEHYIPKDGEVAVMWYKTVDVSHAWQEDFAEEE